MIKSFKKFNNGFRTLIETLVAVSIFTFSILALISVLARGISNTNYAKTKITASYLAGEGIEYMRNLRDTYVLYDLGGAQTGWNNFNTKLTTSSCTAGNGCYFNADNINFADTTQPMIDIILTACGASCPQLLYNSLTGRYGYTGANSGYTRKIVTQIIDVNQTKVSSIISWTQASGNYSVTFSENLFNWVE